VWFRHSLICKYAYKQTIQTLAARKLDPHTEEIVLKIITTANIFKKITGVPIHIKHVFTGVPKIPDDLSVEKTESPSLKRSNGNPIDVEIQIFEV